MVSDDIVTRLRRAQEHADRLKSMSSVIPSDWLTENGEAADEIERLRALTGKLAKLMMPYALLMTKEEQQEVMKAGKQPEEIPLPPEEPF